MSDVSEKWGAAVAQRGFAQVPNYLLLINQFLDKEHRLSPAEILILIQLVGSWWKKDALPFPSMATLAQRCGVSSRQVQRAVNRLEGAGLIQRVKRRSSGIISSNAYDLSPLVALLAEIAKAFPNQFPRNVDKETVAAISEKLKPQKTQDPSPAVEVDFDDDVTPAGLAAKLAAPRPKRKLKRPVFRKPPDG
jgi:predicted transcriptional regulator